MRRIRSVLLCEDLQQGRLLLPVLKQAFRQLPRLEQNGSFSFVLRRLSREIRYVRQRPQEAVALVVVIDGDEAGLIGRLEQVREIGGLKGDSWKAQIAVLIPCRNVETWILWLNGADDVDEANDYKRRVQRDREGEVALARKAANFWHDLAPARRDLEKTRLPALAHARAEIDRLEKLTKS